VCSRVYADKDLSWQVDLHATEFYFTGEEHDLQEILGNIFDNACKWAKQQVHVTTRALDGKAERSRWELVCEDDGPGIAPAQINHILQRGVRGDESAPGSGLGLAIVNDLITVYGGQIQVQRSSLGGALIRLQLG
ncbi:MAG TPA: ATP-binding protein, partial [Paenalcaligenes sp.]|nr:ATP-binding protein [Paenalcaligenes sp.]